MFIGTKRLGRTRNIIYGLRSVSSSALVVPATRRSTLGDRTFAIAGPRAWNNLPHFITDCRSLISFLGNIFLRLFYSPGHSRARNTSFSSYCRLRRSEIDTFTLQLVFIVFFQFSLGYCKLECQDHN